MHIERKNERPDFFAWFIIGFGTMAVILAGANFEFPSADAGLLALGLVTIIFGAKLSFQLPWAKLHVSFADGLIFLTFLVYGWQPAVLLAGLEGLYTSLMFRGTSYIRPKTIALNSTISSLSTFIMAMVAAWVFDDVRAVALGENFNELTLLFSLMVLVQFACNSFFVTMFTARKLQQSYWQVWNECCLNVFIIYIAAAAVASVSLQAFLKIDGFMLAIAIAIAGSFYLTYRRYLSDIRNTAEKAEKAEFERAEAEKMRAEQAEKHIEELRHHIAEQERISEALRENKEMFQHVAYHDPLTGLPNRNYISSRLGGLHDDAKETGSFNYTVLFFDLKRFKNINESLGYAIGDELLICAARRFENLLGDGQELTRFAGDEFVIIWEGNEDLEPAIELAEKVKERMSSVFEIHRHQIFIDMNIGIAVGSPHHEIPEDAIRDAEIAMYFGKARNIDYAIFDPSMQDRARKFLSLETELRRAIERNELTPYYQPIIELKEGNLIGFEALMRWNHPQRGMVSPAEFIPLSEDTGLVIPMTLWIIEAAALQIQLWQNEFGRKFNFWISINLSGKHFAKAELINQIDTILKKTGIAPRSLKFEITESAIMENGETAILMLQELKDLGVKLSIDDFGTGYSSLSYLHRFPVDTLKIDRSFVMNVGPHGENSAIVKTIVTLAKSLNMDIVAEGVESLDQLKLLRELGCEYGQGYLFARPMPNDEATSLLKEGKEWSAAIYSTEEMGYIPADHINHLRLVQ
jgi:diguanylate cyclase (GGDEF)-like protein